MKLLYEISPIIGLALNLMLSMLAARRAKFSRVHQLFTFFFVSMAMWSLTILGMRWSPDLQAALHWERGIFAALPFVSASFYHFTLVFTRAKNTRLQLIILYGLVAVFVALSPTSLLITGMRQMWYGHGFQSTALIYPYMAVFYGFVITALVRLARSYRASQDPLDKSRYFYIAIGAGLCLLGLLLDFLAAGGLPIYPMGVLGNICFSALAAYSILKYNLLDVHIVIRKGTSYIIVSAVIIALYAGLIAIIYIFLTHNWNQTLWFNVIFIVIIALGIQPLLRWTQGMIDRLFYRGRYDYLVALENLSQEIRNITDLRFITESLVNMLITAIQCKNAAVLLPSGDGHYFSIHSSRGMANPEEVRLRKDSALTWLLADRGEILTKEDFNLLPHLKALTLSEREILTEAEVEILVPLTTREGLRGIILLGHKLSERSLSSEEKRVLRVLAQQMAITLDNARLYEMQREKSIQLDIQNRELLEKTIELEIANRSKSMFLANVSHELRTPLNAIIGFSQLIVDGVLGEITSEQKEGVSEILAGGEHLLTLVNDILDLSRVEAGRLDIEFNDFDVAPVIHNVVRALKPMLENKHHTIAVDIQHNLPQICADESRLRQILFNLVSNAVKFTPPGGYIQVQATARDNMCEIDIIDNGIGIKKEDHERIFEAFNQMGTVQGAVNEGAGLGLTLSRRLVELLGGKIWLESEPWHGSRFSFVIPFAKSDTAD